MKRTNTGGFDFASFCAATSQAAQSKTVAAARQIFGLSEECKVSDAQLVVNRLMECSKDHDQVLLNLALQGVYFDEDGSEDLSNIVPLKGSRK